MSEYTQALQKEIKALKYEHEELKKQVRQETLELMNAKTPDKIIKRETVLFLAKRISLVALTLIICVSLGLLISSFVNEMAVPFAEDDSLSDETFVPDNTEELNTTGSGTGLHHLVMQGDYGYFAESGIIYKYTTGQKSPLITADCTYINAYKYCIYFYSADTGSIYRTRTDGNMTQTLAEGLKLRDLKVYNNTVYMLTEEGKILTVYINGKEGRTLSSDKNILSFTVADKYIYYIVYDGSNTSLYRMKMAGTESVKISDTDTVQLAAQDGCLLYIYKGTLFSFSSEKEKSFALFSGNVTEFALLNSSIVVLADKSLYTTDLTGGNIILREENITDLSVVPAEQLLSYNMEYQHTEEAANEQ